MTVLLLGGTGAMGYYLASELINLGFDVFVTSRSARKSNDNKLTYIQGNARDNKFITKTLVDKYDAIVDFMAYSTNEFRQRHELLLKNTKHYIFLSSGRVFAESTQPITENSPRLLDISIDSEYLATDEYALAKARQENILRESQYNNWTIIRPTITYSKTRFQLGTLEANIIIFRSLRGYPVILPQEMLQKKTAMTWGGDVAKMIARLTLNQNTFGEDYNVCTHEYRTWNEIAQYYKKIIGLDVFLVDLDIYIKLIGRKYQILYSRMFNRTWDNSKILNATGLQKDNLMSIYDGLAEELSDRQKLYNIKPNYIINAKIDKITRSRIPLDKASVREKLYYNCAYTGIDVFLKYVKNCIKNNVILCKQ